MYQKCQTKNKITIKHFVKNDTFTTFITFFSPTSIYLLNVDNGTPEQGEKSVQS